MRWMLFTISLIVVFILAISLPSIDDRPRNVTMKNSEHLILQTDGNGAKLGQTRRFVLKDSSGNIAAHTPAYNFKARAFPVCRSGDCYILIYTDRTPWAKSAYKITPDPFDMRRPDLDASPVYGLTEMDAKDIRFESLYLPLLQAPAFLWLCVIFAVLFCIPIPGKYEGTIFNYFAVHKLKFSPSNILTLTTPQTGGLMGVLLCVGLIIGCGYEGLPVILALAVLLPLLLFALLHCIQRGRFD